MCARETFVGFPLHVQSKAANGGPDFCGAKISSTKREPPFGWLSFGTPDWIRTSGLQSRSYQAVKPEALRRKGLVEIAQISAILKKNSEALSDRASEVFRGSSQIVVWIKCGFSSPVRLNIFTLYPWIRSAASHPSTLARSSTIPACAFASSYCFCS